MSERNVLEVLFVDLDRLAPGSESSTLRALSAARRVREPSRILDIGCGTGAQTLLLARNTTASIVAVDMSEAFLARLRAEAEAQDVVGRITTLQASMEKLDFAAGSFDLIWAEGSAYVMGFDAALASWRRLLVPGGVLACSELTWLTDTRSARAIEFWNANYPAARNDTWNLEAAARAGYACEDHFTLPVSDWTDEYYRPLSAKLDELSEKYWHDQTARRVFDETRAEIAFYDACGTEFGYVFYVLRRE